MACSLVPLIACGRLRKRDEDRAQGSGRAADPSGANKMGKVISVESAGPDHPIYKEGLRSFSPTYPAARLGPVPAKVERTSRASSLSFPVPSVRRGRVRATSAGAAGPAGQCELHRQAGTQMLSFFRPVNPQTDPEIYNEQVKLHATFLNIVGAGFITVGVAAPAVAILLQGRTTMSQIFTLLIMWFFGAFLHAFAAYHLTRLQPPPQTE